MKLFPLLKPGHRLLYISFALLIALIQGCSFEKNNSDENEINPKISKEQWDTLLRDSIHKHLGITGFEIVTGHFTSPDKASLAIVQKVDSKDIKNLRVVLIDSMHFVNTKSLLFRTDLLEGEPESVKLEVIQLSNYLNSLIYFNTSDYLMGSSGGEVYHYIIDAANKKTYFAHFIADKRQGLLLYLPSQLTDTSLRNYFIDRVKQSYPEFKLAKYDIIY